MAIKITPIGSCRIHNPLKKFITKSYLELNTADIYGFTHSSSEALQQLKYLQGEYLPSENIRPILSPRLRFHKTTNNQVTADSDLYFVEISSAKTILVHDEYVQMNYIHVYFSEFFLDAHRSKEFWSLAAASNKEELLDFLNKSPVYQAYPAEKKELLSQIRVKHMSEEALKQDMLELVRRVKQVVFVTHCNARLPDMTTISSRENWIRSIENIGKDIGAKVYNPTHLMMGIGQSLCMQKNGLDSTHYTSMFEQKIIDDLQRLYIEPLGNGIIHEEETFRDTGLEPDTLNRLEQLYQQGEIGSVLQQLNNLIRKFPKCPETSEFMGKLLHHVNDFEGAITYFTRLDENHELSNDGRLTLVKCYSHLKQFKEVLNHADLLFEEEIYESELIKLAAIASWALGNFKKARIYWEQLYKCEHYKLEAASQLALLFEQNNDFEAAIFWINCALELNPTDLRLRSTLNKMLATVADEKSLELLIEKINPISADEFIAIARTALGRNFILTAAKSLHKAYELWPNHSNLKKIIANTVVQWLQIIQDKAKIKEELWLQHLKGILLIQPRQGSAIRIRREYIHNQRAELKTAYKQTDYDKAISAGIRIYFLQDDLPGIALLIGRSFYAKLQFEEALVWFTKATDLNKSDLSTWMLRIKAALKTENFIEAISALRSLPSEFIPHEEYKINAQLVLQKAKNYMIRLMEYHDLERSWQLSDSLNTLCPGDSKVLRTRVLLLKKMVEQLKEADSPQMQIKLAKSIYDKDPNNIQALRILAVSLMKQKKLEESLLYWEKLCILFPEVNSYKLQAQKCLYMEESGLTIKVPLRPAHLA